MKNGKILFALVMGIVLIAIAFFLFLEHGRLPLFRSPEETFCDYSCAAVSDPCIIKDKAATRFRKPRRILI